MAVSNYEELSSHVGHKIECVYYGDGKEIVNVSLECTDCNEVIMDFDKPDEIKVRDMIDNFNFINTVVA